MFRRFGAAGIFGILVVVAGLSVIFYANWKIGAGLTLVLFGLALTVRSLITQVMANFGMA